MIIYDGETLDSPILYSYNGPGDPPPGNIVASDDNESGCLTIYFNSGNNESDGWFAEIDCQYPCQDFTVQIESSDWINALGQLEACYDIDLNALTDYLERITNIISKKTTQLRLIGPLVIIKFLMTSQ